MTWRTIALVMRREWKAARKPFLVSTTIILTVVGLGLAAVTWAQRNEPVRETWDVYGIGVVGATPIGLKSEIRTWLPERSDVETKYFVDLERAEQELSEGKVSAVVVEGETVLWSPYARGPIVDSLVQALRTIELRERAAELELSSADVEWMLEDHLTFRTVEAAEDLSKAEEAASAIAVIVMFTAIIAYGQWIGYSVAEEKGSRVVELILGAVPPHHLLSGKLIAVGSMGLAQMTLVGSLVVGYSIAADLVNIPDVATGLVVWMLVWFFLGYAFYGSLYAAGGSLAADTHEASSTLTVLNLVPIFGYVFGLITFSQGSDTFLLRLSSLIPLWAPMTMPGRIARGWATPPEVAVSILLMVLAIYGVIRFAGWVYRGGVARAGSKLRWSEALRTGRDLRTSRN